MEVKFTSRVSDVIREKNAAIERGLEAIGLQAEGYAKTELTRQEAVDTGRLRNSVTHYVKDNTAYIGTNVEYGMYIEFGTSKMKARPFLRPAARNHTSEYQQIFQSELDKLDK